MKVGIMLMSNCGPDGQPWDWIQHLMRCKEHGVQMVDLFEQMIRLDGLTIRTMRNILDDLGLQPSIYCVRTDFTSPDSRVRSESLDAIKRGVEACHELGINLLFNYGGQHGSKGEDAFARFVDGLADAVDVAGEAGIILSIENAGTLCHTDTELLRCIKAVGKPNLKITFDGGNFILAGCNPHSAAELLASEVVHVHVKSFMRVTDEAQQLSPDKPFKYCPVGQGLVDYRKIRAILTTAGFDGCMSFEPEGGHDSRWYESLDALTQIVKG